MRRRHCAAMLGLVTCLHAVTSAQAALREPRREPDPLENAVRASLEPNYFGAVLVLRDQSLALEDLRGIATLDGAAPTADTLFDIASISKQFTAAAILRLWERNRLSLHDRLDRFFPKIPEGFRDIRVENLLAHTSGLLQSTDFGPEISNHRDRWLEALWQRRREGRAGERAMYSNAGYGVLAAIVEVVSHERFESFVRREVFLRAGLTSTGFFGESSPAISARSRARRLHGSDHTALDWTYDWNHRGAVGVVTTATDLIAWHRALDDQGRFSRALRDRLLEPFERDYAGGLFTKRDPLERRRQWHSGAIEGFQCWFARYPDDDSLIVVLANENYRLSTMVEGLESALFALPPPSAIREPWLGLWGSDDGAVRVRQSDGNLSLELLGARALALDFPSTDRDRLVAAERDTRELRRAPPLRDARRLLLAELGARSEEWFIAAVTESGLRHHRVERGREGAWTVSDPLPLDSVGHRLPLRWRTRDHFDARCRSGLETLHVWKEGSGSRANLRLELGNERIALRRDGSTIR